MPGKRVPEWATFVSPRAVYRSGVDAIDSGGPTDTGIPILDTVPPPNDGGHGDYNQYGQNAQIAIDAVLDKDANFSTVGLELWLKAVNEVIPTPMLSSSSSSPTPAASSSSSSLADTNDWVLVDSWTLQTSALYPNNVVGTHFVEKDIPPGQYKVLVVTMKGTGKLTILEQHAT